MPKILHTIPPRNYEYCRDRIAEILIDELAYQWQYSYNPHLNAEVLLESNGPYQDKTMLPLVSVSVAKGKFGNAHQGSRDGHYMFFLDIVTNAKTTKDVGGDVTATLRMQRLMSVVQAILEDPIYKTLGFVPGFIKRTYFNEFDIAPIDREDALNTAQGRLIFNVEVQEKTQLTVPKIADGFDTVVKIGGTNEGYFYQEENYGYTN